MNLVFMNSLEKKVGEHRVITGQVCIQENQGMWQVHWTEPDDSGRLNQVHWFDGHSWDEMLTVFRFRLAEKISEGYIPLLDAMFDHDGRGSDKVKFTQMLHYYCDMQTDDEIYQKLRIWRNDQASKEGIPPYIIASNRVLKMISVFLPYTGEELKQIPGFGEKKAAIYGEDVIQITKKKVRARTFPLDWVPKEIDLPSFNQWLYKQKELKYKQQMEKEITRKHLLEGIQAGKDLDTMESEYSIPRKDLIMWMEQLDKEGYDLSPLILRTLEPISEEEKSLAWKAFMELGDQYLKPIMQKVYSEDAMKNKDLDRVYEWLRILRIQFRKNKEEEKQTHVS